MIDDIEKRYNIVASSHLNVFWIPELTNSHKLN